MNKHFMIDIETTGVDLKTDDILSIGALEVEFDGRFWHPGRSFETFLYSDRKPANSFAREHMQALYDKCNALPMQYTPLAASIDLLFFFGECEAKNANDTFLMGWNASNFDVPFLVEHEILAPSRYVPGPDGKDVMVGDFHYRIYEMGGAVSLAQDVLNEHDRKRLLLKAEEAAPNLFAMPEGKEHDALYDCYKQLRLLNGLIALVRDGGKS